MTIEEAIEKLKENYEKALTEASDFPPVVWAVDRTLQEIRYREWQRIMKELGKE